MVQEKATFLGFGTTYPSVFETTHFVQLCRPEWKQVSGADHTISPNINTANVLPVGNTQVTIMTVFVITDQLF